MNSELIDLLTFACSGTSLQSAPEAGVRPAKHGRHLKTVNHDPLPLRCFVPEEDH